MIAVRDAFLGMLRAPKYARAAGHAESHWDAWLILCVTTLIGLGMVMVFSSSISIAQRTTGNSFYYLIRHTIAIALGLVVMGAAMRTRIVFWEKAGPTLLLTGMLLLVVVLTPVGSRVNGSARWIPLGVFNLQPAELMKIFMIVYVAGYLVRRKEELRSFLRGIVMMSLVFALVGVLLLLEPDLGSTVVICTTTFAMLFLGGVRFSHFLMVILAGVVGLVMLTVLSPYRMARVTGFIDPWADPFGSGYQLTHALIAFGRGEWFGVGLGASVQKLNYLPAAHTDFLFSILAEELGLIGVLTVIAIFAVLVWRAFVIAGDSERRGRIYGARLAAGIGVLFAFQAAVNMGVNMGVLPTKGLTLPFMSYGGSSMLVCCLAAGMLLRVGYEARSGRSES